MRSRTGDWVEDFISRPPYIIRWKSAEWEWGGMLEMKGINKDEDHTHNILPMSCPAGWKAGSRWLFGVQSPFCLFLALPFLLLKYSHWGSAQKTWVGVADRICVRFYLFCDHFFLLSLKWFHYFLIAELSLLFLFIPMLCIDQFCLTDFVKIT